MYVAIMIILELKSMAGRKKALLAGLNLKNGGLAMMKLSIWPNISAKNMRPVHQLRK
jgi:hypothetical protein